MPRNDSLSDSGCVISQSSDVISTQGKMPAYFIFLYILFCKDTRDLHAKSYTSKWMNHFLRFVAFFCRGVGLFCVSKSRHLFSLMIRYNYLVRCVFKCKFSDDTIRYNFIKTLSTGYFYIQSFINIHKYIIYINILYM